MCVMDLDDDVLIESDLFDISDVVFDIPPTRNKCKIYLVAKSDTPFTLMKYYLALKSYVEKIEAEMNIFEEPEQRM